MYAIYTESINSKNAESEYFFSSENLVYLPPDGVTLVLSTQRGQVLVVAGALRQVMVYILNDGHFDGVGLGHGYGNVLFDVYRHGFLHGVRYRLLYLHRHWLLHRHLHRLVHWNLDAFSHLQNGEVRSDSVQRSQW